MWFCICHASFWRVIFYLQTHDCHSVIEQENTEKGSFLWRVESTPPSYFFGTIHVPYVRVWDAIPQNVKLAFAASKRVFFELDLTKANTISALSACQSLPRHRHLSQVIDMIKPEKISWKSLSLFIISTYLMSISRKIKLSEKSLDSQSYIQQVGIPT